MKVGDGRIQFLLLTTHSNELDQSATDIRLFMPSSPLDAGCIVFWVVHAFVSGSLWESCKILSFGVCRFDNELVRFCGWRLKVKIIPERIHCESKKTVLN